MSEKKRLRDTDKDIISIEALDGGGFKMECKNPDGTKWNKNYYGLVSYDSLKNLQGKVLTLIDGCISDLDQRKAVKDMFKRMFWFDWVEFNIYQGKDNNVGMPID